MSDLLTQFFFSTVALSFNFSFALTDNFLAFIVAMLAAGVIGSLLDSGSAFWMILGGALGYFATRLVAAARAAMDARKDS